MSNQVEKVVVFPKPDGKFWVCRMQWEIKDDGPHFINYVGNLTEADQKNVDVAAYLALNPKDQQLIGNPEPKDVVATPQPGVIGTVRQPVVPSSTTVEAGVSSPGRPNPRS